MAPCLIGDAPSSAHVSVLDSPFTQDEDYFLIISRFRDVGDKDASLMSVINLTSISVLARTSPLIGSQILSYSSHPQPTMADTDSQGADYEAEHVHSVYEEIASHFSSTRYKVCVTVFLPMSSHD
jgi:hypothetical protein